MVDKIYKIYHAPLTIDGEDNLDLLARKVFNRYSRGLWTTSRVNDHLSIKKNTLTLLRHDLLSSFSAKQLHLEYGAYIDFHQYLDTLVTTYSSYSAFLLPKDDIKLWNWKFSWDNVKIHNKPMQVWTLSPLSVIHNQQPQHSHVVMYANISETNLSMKRCVVESQLQDFLLDLNSYSFRYQGFDIYTSLTLTADWMGMVYELSLSVPGTRNLIDAICFRCGCNKMHLRYNYLDDPF